MNLFFMRAEDREGNELFNSLSLPTALLAQKTAAGLESSEQKANLPILRHKQRQTSRVEHLAGRIWSLREHPPEEDPG